MNVTRLSLRMLALLMSLAAASCVYAATYYVAQGGANASDENAGSEEQPWQTLAHAAEQVGPGDTVFIKAGTYRETLRLTTDKVTVEAFGDDAVIITRPESEVIEAAVWQPVADREDVYEWEASVKGKILVVDDRAIHFEKTEGMKVTQTFDYGAGRTEKREVDRRLEDEDLWRWTSNADGTIHLNLGGEDPREHRVELIEGSGGVRLEGNDCRIRGLQVRDVTTGISIGGQRNVVEDCLVEECWVHGLDIGGAFNVLRRSAVIDCGWGVNTGGCHSDSSTIRILAKVDLPSLSFYNIRISPLPWLENAKQGGGCPPAYDPGCLFR